MPDREEDDSSSSSSSDSSDFEAASTLLGGSDFQIPHPQPRRSLGGSAAVVAPATPPAPQRNEQEKKPVEEKEVRGPPGLLQRIKDTFSGTGGQLALIPVVLLALWAARMYKKRLDAAP